MRHVQNALKCIRMDIFVLRMQAFVHYAFIMQRTDQLCRAFKSYGRTGFISPVFHFSSAVVLLFFKLNPVFPFYWILSE